MANVIIVIYCLCTVYSTVLGVDYKNEFEQWMLKYSKEYSTGEEYKFRLKIFRDNSQLVKEFNRQHGPDLLMATNQFADLTFDEFSNLYLMDPQDCSATVGNHYSSGRSVPQSVDWREKNVVTPIKDQGACGSCWSFSTTGCLESHHAIKTGQLLSLSEQQLVDCAGAFKNKGCGGGLPSQAFEYIRYNGGIETEKDYPYRGVDGKCRYDSSLVAATVSDVVNITKGAEDDITDAVANVGPVSIAFDVNLLFQFYHHGIYKGFLCHKDQRHTNHAVLVVGYNVTKSGEEYWIVKNSWGPEWGMNGYFWIEKGKNACGLADCPSYPIV